MVQVPPQGYLLDLTNIILVVSNSNLSQAHTFFKAHGLKIVMGSRYMGGYTSTPAAHPNCLGEKVKNWVSRIKTLAGVVRRHLQAYHTCLQNSLQYEWGFVQRATYGLGEDFVTVEKSLCKYFLPALFLGAESHMPQRDVAMILIK